MPERSTATESDDTVRARILSAASQLFYEHGVRAVGVDLVIDRAGVAKASLYRHFRTKDDLIAAYLEREDRDFWATWDAVHAEHADDPAGELTAHMAWIGARIGRPRYRGCPQINVAAEFADADHPARLVAIAHKRELRRRLTDIASRLGAAAPEQLGGQLTIMVNGAFVSASIVAPNEAVGLLTGMAACLVATAAQR